MQEALFTYNKYNKLNNFYSFKNHSNVNKFISNNWVILYKRNQLNNARLGITIKKKYVKKANERNCFKRIIKENFRLKQIQLMNYDFVFIARKNLQNQKKELIKSELNSQWVYLISKLKNSLSVA